MQIIYTVFVTVPGALISLQTNLGSPDNKKFRFYRALGGWGRNFDFGFGRIYYLISDSRFRRPLKNVVRSIGRNEVLYRINVICTHSLFGVRAEFGR